VSKILSKYRNSEDFYDYEESVGFQPRKKKREEQKSGRKKSNSEDYDYFASYENSQKTTKRKVKHFI
jgi:hypothetical protein